MAVEAALGAELDAHLGYSKHEARGLRIAAEFTTMKFSVQCTQFMSFGIWIAVVSRRRHQMGQEWSREDTLNINRQFLHSSRVQKTACLSMKVIQR